MFLTSFWKFLLALGIILGFAAFVLGWISFGVPDWHSFKRYNTSYEEYYGLWAYCQDQSTSYGAVCKRWSTAETMLFNGTRPSFIRTTEGLITTGMILLSLGLVAGIIAAVLPYLGFIASLIAILGFTFLVIGLPIFGEQSNNLSIRKPDFYYNKRYGFWLMVPTIILCFLAGCLFFLAAVAYKIWGYGNIFTSSNNKAYGGRKKLGPPHAIAAPGYLPYATSSGQLFNNDGVLPISYGYPTAATPPLLSQYLNRRLMRSYETVEMPAYGMGSIAPPSIARAMAPSYLRAGEPVGPRFTPIVNLTGQTLVGPLLRTA